MAASFSTRYGPWALITGASRGLGAEFARQCAERGLNLVLIATKADLLKTQADSIKLEYDVEVRQSYLTSAGRTCCKGLPRSLTPWKSDC